MRFFIALFFPIIAFSFSFDQRLAKGDVGNYWVVTSGKMVTLLSIHAMNESSLIFEEISIPEENAKKIECSWPQWVKERAPGHSSWSMIEIDPTSGEILECYSFSKGAWLKLSSQESLIATLLHLPLQKVPPQDLRRIGPAPLSGETDFRKIWQPPAVFEGKKTHFSCDVYQTVWPKDGTELSNQKILLYFDKEIQFPFPFWVQVETTHLQFSIRTLDAGKQLISPYKTFPRRSPEWVGQPEALENGSLKLMLKSPRYYHQFDLFAIDITEKEQQIIPIDFTLTKQNDELFSLIIEEETLKNFLTSGHTYSWLLIPVQHNESFIQSKKTFTYLSSS